MTERKRHALIQILPSHGAYLLMVTGTLGADLTTHEQVSAAGSREKAREVAVQMAESLDCTGPFQMARWVVGDRMIGWQLLGYSDQLDEACS